MYAAEQAYRESHRYIKTLPKLTANIISKSISFVDPFALLVNYICYNFTVWGKYKYIYIHVYMSIKKNSLRTRDVCHSFLLDILFRRSYYDVTISWICYSNEENI